MLKYLFALLIVSVSFLANSQTQDPTSPGFDFNMLTTDSNSSNQDVQEGDQAPEAPVAKPYQRIVLNMDTLTNLILYTGIVEQEESSSDSLYARTKAFAQKVFLSAKGEPKGLYEVDKKNQKLVINGQLTAYSYTNKYSKLPIGKYYFKMTVLFKEGRYRYIITNLVHEAEKPNVGTAARNYFEYYYTTTTGIKQVDQILRYADKDLNKMIENFKKSLKEQIEIDEDEW